MTLNLTKEKYLTILNQKGCMEPSKRHRSDIQTDNLISIAIAKKQEWWSITEGKGNCFAFRMSLGVGVGFGNLVAMTVVYL